MRSDTANGGISQLEDHYKTFIVSQDSLIGGRPPYTNVYDRPKKTSLKLLVPVSTLFVFLSHIGRLRLVTVSLFWRRLVGREFAFCIGVVERH